MIDDKVMILKAVADKNRLRILNMLESQSLCVCEITSVLNLAVSTVSQHLKILRQSGFIEEEKDGKWVYYRINPHPSNPAVSSILGMLNYWLEGDNEIKIDDGKLCCIDRRLKKV